MAHLPQPGAPPQRAAARDGCRRRGRPGSRDRAALLGRDWRPGARVRADDRAAPPVPRAARAIRERSEEHTSELQSRSDIVCRLLLEIKTRDTDSALPFTT